MYSLSVLLGCLIKLLLDKTEVLSDNEGLSYDNSVHHVFVYLCVNSVVVHLGFVFLCQFAYL